MKDSLDEIISKETLLLIEDLTKMLLQSTDDYFLLNLPKKKKFIKGYGAAEIRKKRRF